MSSWNARRRALGLSLALGLGVGSPGCGGGGGGGPPATTGAITGTLLLPDADFGAVVEAEPNGSATQAQAVPPLMPRSTVTLAGDAGTSAAGFGAADPVDAFRVFTHLEQDVTLTLTTSTGGAVLGDLDVAAFDTATGNPLGSAATSSNPEVLSFTLAADATADLVVTCASGYGAYTLRVETADPVVPLVGSSGPAYATPARPSAPLAFDAVAYAVAPPACAPGRLLVRGRDGDGAAADRAARSARGRVVRSTSAGTRIVEFGPRFSDTGGREALALAARLAQEKGVRWAEPDFVVRALAEPDDADYGRQWHLPAIGVPAAWDVTYGSASVTVGIVDTGIRPHPDLDPQTVPGYDFVTDESVSLDGDGRDPNPTDPGVEDLIDGRSTFHGTHIAGIVAARGNDGNGLCGVAPGCRVMMLRALGKGGGTVSDVADAIRYGAGLAATAHGPALPAPLPILNLSIGTSAFSAEFEDACLEASNAGVLLVSSTGNTAGPVLYPAAFPTVLAVGAVDSRLVRASYSNQGPPIDLLGTGGGSREIDADGLPDEILSTGVDGSRGDLRPGESYMTGTSMAAAAVAGVAALVKSVDPTLTAAEVRADLLATCVDLDDPGFDVRTGAGLVHAGEAVRRALADAGTPRSDPARLHLSSESLRFRWSDTTHTVRVSNAGAGFLSLALFPANSTDSGAGWLSSFCTLTVPPSPTNVAEVVVSVDRTGLADGVYCGSVLVTSPLAVLGSIRVVMEVGAAPLLEGATFQIVAREVGTGTVRASGFAYPWEGYRYLLQGLLPGDYTLFAGTDFDGDDVFCEGPDWCGTDLTPIHVEAGDFLTGRDLVLVP
jgi:serine protease